VDKRMHLFEAIGQYKMYWHTDCCNNNDFAITF